MALAVIGGIIAAGMAFGPSLSLGAIYADNPWGSEPVTVNVTYVDGSSDATAEKALDTELKNWEENAPAWTNQTANFSRGASENQADLRVIFVNELDECGRTHDSRIAGCAHIEQYESGTVVDAEIRIERGHSYNDLRKIIRHEIGHVYGLEHSDSDRLPWMAESSRVVQ